MTQLNSLLEEPSPLLVQSMSLLGTAVPISVSSAAASTGHNETEKKVAPVTSESKDEEKALQMSDQEMQLLSSIVARLSMLSTQIDTVTPTEREQYEAEIDKLDLHLRSILSMVEAAK